MPAKDNVRVAAVGDLHCTRSSQGAFQAMFAQVGEAADVLALCGDLCDYGTAEEANILAHELVAVRVPVVAVLGNHDYEAGQQEEVKRILQQAGVIILDGEACEIHGVGFAGVKGFAGGFGRHALGAWGEEAIKAFVHEAVAEALKLESALARLRTEKRIVLLHYSPIQETLVGEPQEVFPFLGTSRLEEPLLRFPVTAVFHGHAHSGSLAGTTRAGTPVFNVALPLLRRLAPSRRPFHVIEMSPASPQASAATHNNQTLLADVTLHDLQSQNGSLPEGRGDSAARHAGLKSGADDSINAVQYD